MQTVSTIQSLRSRVKAWKQAGLTVAFVPTMGNLHEGHFSLVEKAKSVADKVVVSIFVNPMQFGAGEDLNKYPRTLEQDQLGLEALHTDLLFTPTPDIIYPKGLDAQSYIEVIGVSEGHCGGSRPGHFRGVATVVAKLFNLVQPDYACFGEKDFQQLQVIRTMVEDLSFAVEIIPVATKRLPSGLAMSSRNGYLTPEQKETAKVLYETLCQSAETLKVGDVSIEQVVADAKVQLTAAGLQPDYYNIVARQSLKPAQSQDKQLIILAAAFLGSVRLIDNLQFNLE